MSDSSKNGMYVCDMDGYRLYLSHKAFELPIKLNHTDAETYCQLLGMAMPTEDEMLKICQQKEKLERWFNLTRPWHWTSTQFYKLPEWLAVSVRTGHSARADDFLKCAVRPVIRVPS